MVGNFFNKQPPHTLRITEGIKAKKKKKKNHTKGFTKHKDFYSCLKSLKEKDKLTICCYIIFKTSSFDSADAISLKGDLSSLEK